MCIICDTQHKRAETVWENERKTSDRQYDLGNSTEFMMVYRFSINCSNFAIRRREGQMLTEAAWRRNRDKQLERLERQRDACLAAAKNAGHNAPALRGLARDLRRQIELLRY